MIKTLSKLGTERNFLNLVKNIYEKSTANILLNGERQDDFLHSTIVNKSRVSPLDTPIQSYTAVLTCEIRLENKIKGIKKLDCLITEIDCPSLLVWRTW